MCPCPASASLPRVLRALPWHHGTMAPFRPIPPPSLCVHARKCLLPRRAKRPCVVPTQVGGDERSSDDTDDDVTASPSATAVHVAGIRHVGCARAHPPVGIFGASGSHERRAPRPRSSVPRLNGRGGEQLLGYDTADLCLRTVRDRAWTTSSRTTASCLTGPHDARCHRTSPLRPTHARARCAHQRTHFVASNTMLPRRILSFLDPQGLCSFGMVNKQMYRAILRTPVARYPASFAKSCTWLLTSATLSLRRASTEFAARPARALSAFGVAVVGQVHVCRLRGRRAHFRPEHGLDGPTRTLECAASRVLRSIANPQSAGCGHTGHTFPAERFCRLRFHAKAAAPNAMCVRAKRMRGRCRAAGYCKEFHKDLQRVPRRPGCSCSGSSRTRGRRRRGSGSVRRTSRARRRPRASSRASLSASTA